MPSATLVITLILLVVAVATDKIVRRKVAGHIDALYSTGNGSDLLVYLDSHLVKYLYPSFNRAFMRVNAYELIGDAKGEGRELAMLLSEKRLDEKQRHTVVLRGFEFYLKERENKKARELLNEIERWDNFPSADMYSMLFEVVTNNSASYIQACEDILTDTEGADRLQLLYLLSKQYKNIGRTEIAREYETQSIESLGELRSGKAHNEAT